MPEKWLAIHFRRAKRFLKNLKRWMWVVLKYFSQLRGEGRACILSAGKWTTPLQGRPRPPTPVRTETPGILWHAGPGLDTVLGEKQLGTFKEFHLNIDQKASELSISWEHLTAEMRKAKEVLVKENTTSRSLTPPWQWRSQMMQLYRETRARSHWEGNGNQARENIS